MIYWPRHFDSNEWFVSLFLALGICLIYRVPKRFPTSITLLILVYAAAMSRIFDHMLAGPAFQDMYDIMDWNKIEYFDLLTYAMFAPPGYLFIYFYDRWELKGLPILLYILGWALFSSGIEWIAHLCHVFVYKEWKISYSFITYLSTLPLTLLFFEWIKKQHAKKASTPSAS